MTSPRDDLPAAVTWGRMQTFLAVVDRGSVRAAAEALHVTPPAVSAAITAMERELGVALFVKAGRGITPTEAGRSFADSCRTMLGMLEEARDGVREAERSRLRLGAVESASEVVLPRLMAAFVRQHPTVELSLSVLPRDDLFARAGHHELDVVLAGRAPPGSHLVSRASRPNELVLVASPALQGDPLTATWLLRGPGSGTRGSTTTLLAQLEARPRTLTLGTHGAVVAAAREGLGVTLVHAEAVRRDLDAGRLVVVPLPGTPLDRSWHLTTPRQLTRAARLFVSLVTDPAAVGADAFHLPTRPGG
ncbi:MAG TPA: LysR family transcriptional regulator [Dermatophilaceae bacterium]|nr:LysR family transcriptional regulator [Dermatophilaceae bacterium]